MGALSVKALDPAGTAARDRPRLLILDLVRLMAAVAVLLFHYTARNHAHWGAPPRETFGFVSQFTAYGFLGVQLFFIISGFVIFLSAEGRSVGQFVAGRVSRLFPAYWVAVTLTAGLLLAGVLQFTRPVSVSMYLTNLTMVQRAFGVRDIDGVYWTLWVELVFYVLIALLLSRRGLGEPQVYAFAFLWPLVGAIALRTHTDFVAQLLVPKYAPLFAGGMILYLIHSRGHSLVRWLLLGFNIALAVQQTVKYEIPKFSGLSGVPLSSTAGAAIVVALFAGVAIMTLTPLRDRGAAWMARAGALTYPLYLVHQYWGWWIIWLVNPILGKWIALAAATLVSLLLAVAIERWIERPLRSRLRRGILRSFARFESCGSGRDPGPR